MIFVLDEKSGKPAYIQLYEVIKRDIVKGIFPRGKKLPSKRTMAEQTGLSVITIEHAYTLLQDEGYIEARVRSGYYVIYKASDFQSVGISMGAQRRTLEQVEGKNIPSHRMDPAFSASSFSKTMRRVLLDYGELLMERSPAFGDLRLRQQISAYLARSRSMYVSERQIVVGAGAEYLYGLIAQFYKNKGSFAVEWPCYEKICQVYEAEGIEIERLNLEGDGIASDSLDGAKSKILHITPFHSFPTGISADISKRREYVSWAEEKHGIIIEDNYDSELTISRKMEDSLFSLSNGKNVIYINTFSKTIAPSIRVGYMVLPEDIVDVFTKRLGFYSCTVPLLEQFFLAEILENGEFERHINKIRRYRRKNSEAISL